MKKYRLFISTNLNDSLKKHLSETIKKIKDRFSFINLVKPENIHITIKFLGETQEDKIPTICEVLQNTVSKFQRFYIKLNNLGVFPGIKEPKIIWIGINDDQNHLYKINQFIEEEMEKIGFPKENKFFKSHITLGRIKKLPKNHNISIDILKELSFNYTDLEEINKILLIQSILYPTGPVYKTLYEFNLNI